MKLILGLSLVLLVCGNGAWADTTSTFSVPTSSSQSSLDEIMAKVRKNVRAHYQLWFRGSNVKALSGNSDGNGTNLLMTHYLGLGYRISSKWSISVTQPFTQRIDNKPADEVDPFASNDPYLSLTNPRVLNSQRYGFNLLGQLRYYLPFSRGTSQAVAKAAPADTGHGMFRFLVAPSKTWLDGALNFTPNIMAFYRLPARTNAERTTAQAAKGGSGAHDHLSLIFDPVLSYALSEKLELYLEYAASMDHSTAAPLGSKWTKWKTEDYVSPGANIQLTKKLLLNPYLDFPPRIDDLNLTGVGLQAIYSFL